MTSLLVMVGAGVALTAGWPLLNAVLPDTERLRAGSTLTLSPGAVAGDGDAPKSARFTVGRGWTMSRSESNPRNGYRLRHGTVELAVAYLMPPRAARAHQFWSGLRETVKIADAGARLGRPNPVTNARGTSGVTGTLDHAGRTGRASIFPSRAGDYAVEIQILGPPGARRGDRAEAERVAGTLTLP
ncbi:hypothetical protein [Spirillospora sp. CA-294931]|uniref:hypothetical protein n=1 Tax=Spirillospora sp. CA-294931 TaxID=3240042 RepID=UPI003D8A4723